MALVLEEVWARYVASWKASTEEEKRAMFEGCLAPSCVYTDPTARAEGWSALIDHMLAFHRQLPGGHFVTERFFSYQGRSAARWTMRDGAGSPIGDGLSYAEYDDQGRLVTMTGFFDVPGGR